MPEKFCIKVHEVFLRRNLSLIQKRYDLLIDLFHHFGEEIERFLFVDDQWIFLFVHCTLG